MSGTLVTPSREEMILSLARMVSVNARVLIRKGVPLDPEELESAGWLGAVEAVGRYSPATRVPLNAFARIRIRGAMLDYLRESDPLSRGHRRRVKSGLQDDPHSFSIDAVRVDELTGLGYDDPRIAHAIAAADCAKLWQCLTLRPLWVIYLGYFEEMKYQEIAKALGVSKSRAVQIQKAAIKKMRGLVKGNANG